MRRVRREEGVEEVSSLYHLPLICRARGRDRQAAELLEPAREFGRSTVS